MGVLSGLEPKAVFRFFEELCAIPHGSHNTRAISDYLVDFAESHRLKFRRDEFNNVIIWKAPTAGYEHSPAVMIQGHVDMVAEKDADCAKDMEKEGLDLFVDGDLVGARGTTLGGDDGIAVAMALAILDADDIPHGPLECLFTVDEEVGMLGARGLDASDLTAKYLLNLDSEEEKVLTVSCAGSTRAVCTLPVSRAAYEGAVCKLTLDGLMGGHSGEEIHKGRANANILMGRALSELMNATDLLLIAVSGGAKDNAIPRDAVALVAVKDLAAAEAAAKALGEALQNEYRTADPDIRVSLEPAASDLVPMDEDSTRRVAAFLFCAPNGVQMMSAEVAGLVQTSLNLGQVYTDGDAVIARFMIRSSVNSQAAETTGGHGGHPRLLFRLAVPARFSPSGRDGGGLPGGVRGGTEDRGPPRRPRMRHPLREDAGPRLHLLRAGSHQHPHPPGAAARGFHGADLGADPRDPQAPEVRRKA